MTSASELFFNRRYRFDSRNPNPSLADEGPFIHRRQLHRRPSRSDDGYGQPVRRVSFFGEASLIPNDRLPGSVLQARARLLQRLHGIDIPEESELGAVNIDDNWEPEIAQEWNELYAQETTSSKKPPGLSKEMIHSLPQEIYSDLRDNDGVVKACYECCICLENFESGERLFSLPCSHRFHPPCLGPWLESCGDCPYCRARI